MKILLAFSLLTLTIVSAGLVERQTPGPGPVVCSMECFEGCPEGTYCTGDENYALYGCKHCVEYPTELPLLIKKRQDCQPVLCRMYCANGWALDSDTGCEICKCA